MRRAVRRTRRRAGLLIDTRSPPPEVTAVEHSVIIRKLLVICAPPSCHMTATFGKITLRFWVISLLKRRDTLGLVEATDRLQPAPQDRAHRNLVIFNRQNVSMQ